MGYDLETEIRNNAILSVGTNINALINVEKARKILAAEQILLDQSSFGFTKPVGFLDQPDFLNGAFYIQTQLDFDALDKYLKQVEVRLGRIKTRNKSGPRVMDLDIIVFNSKIVHKDFRHDFVYEPVQELAHRNNILIE